MIRYFANIALLVSIYNIGGFNGWLVAVGIELVILLLINCAFRFVSNRKQVNYTVRYWIAVGIDVASLVTCILMIIFRTIMLL